jgi:hypothetical protein
VTFVGVHADELQAGDLLSSCTPFGECTPQLTNSLAVLFDDGVDASTTVIAAAARHNETVCNIGARYYSKEWAEK